MLAKRLDIANLEAGTLVLANHQADIHNLSVGKDEGVVE